MSRTIINLLRIEEKLSEGHLRLAGVTIEHLPWYQFIKTYDKPGTLFFLDPPYYKAPYYNYNFEITDFRELAETLVGIRSDFLLSINDHPQMRKVFSGFRVRPVKLFYSAFQGDCMKAQGLLITK